MPHRTVLVSSLALTLLRCVTPAAPPVIYPGVTTTVIVPETSPQAFVTAPAPAPAVIAPSAPVRVMAPSAVYSSPRPRVIYAAARSSAPVYAPLRMPAPAPMTTTVIGTSSPAPTTYEGDTPPPGLVRALAPRAPVPQRPVYTPTMIPQGAWAPYPMQGIAPARGPRIVRRR